MTLPFSLPDWLPWWVPFAVLVPALLYGLVFLLMPFSVLGVRGRLDAIEARLDEIQGEIRSLALRLPEPLRGGYEEPSLATLAQRHSEPEPQFARPPIPPAPHYPELDPARDRWTAGREAPRRREPGRGGERSLRSEPRLDRPR